VMELVKAAIDVGLFTDQPAAHLRFWKDELRLTAEPPLRLGGGIHQHRFDAGMSVIKINNSLHPLKASRSGIAQITLFQPEPAATGERRDPDENIVSVAAAPHEASLSVQILVSDVARHSAFWRDVFGLTEERPGVFNCGASQIFLWPGGLADHERSWRSLGFSYLTFQVLDCVHEHQACLDRGASEGAAPLRIGDAAIISFVCDPDGNFIELSQKASLTGPLGKK
jgi:predicted enzyme related to lactoylglutathione lyase